MKSARWWGSSGTYSPNRTSSSVKYEKCQNTKNASSSVKYEKCPYLPKRRPLAILCDMNIPPPPMIQASEDVTELAKQNTSLAISTLCEIAAGGKSESARVAAAQALLDRAYGKVSQMAVEVGEGADKIRVEIV